MKMERRFHRVSVIIALVLICSMIAGQVPTNPVFAEARTTDKIEIMATGGANADMLAISKPKFDEAANKVTFSVENLTAEDKSITIEIRSFDNGEISEVNEYSMSLKSGTEKTEVTLPAKNLDTITIFDGKGNSYAKALILGVDKNLTWLTTWASAQQSLDPNRSEYPPAPGLKGNTFRQIIRISQGGTQIRLKFSNEYGGTPLVLNSVHIAKPVGVGKSTIDPSTDTVVTFEGGSTSVSIPAGKIMTSDPISFDAKDLDRIAISTCFDEVPTMVTSHTGGRTTAYLSLGNHVSDESLTPIKTNEQWYYITGVDVMAPLSGKAIACFGDSITDGRGVTTNLDNRWTDILANRLQANESTANMTVLNEGIGGNAIFGGLGPAGIRRFGRDIFNHEGVGYAIIFIGINDIGSAKAAGLADQIIERYKNFAEQAHAKGIKIYGATITPFKGSSYYDTQYGELREEIRQKINDWIRNNDSFDGFIDFDAAVRDASDPQKIAKEYNSDNLHLNPAGYKKMGECIDLTLFEK